MPLKRNGSAPGEHRGGRKKGSLNKVPSIPQIMDKAQANHPTMDAAGLQRYAAAGILAEIEKVRASGKKYNAKVLVDWYVKLARVAEGYGKDDDRTDFVEVRAELSRLNPEQLLVLKQLALIASGGSTSGSPAGATAAAVRRTIQGKTGSGRARKDP